MAIDVGIRAEWDPLKQVLVHPPSTVETLLSLIHPEANLYESMFSIKKAQLEHANFQDTLTEQGGVKVSLLTDALSKNPNLRKEVVDFFDYKRLDGVEFTKSEKDDNRKLQETVSGQLDRELLPYLLFLSPTVELDCVGKKDDGSNKYLKIKDTLNPLGNLYFTRDQQICTDKGIVLGRMGKAPRADEPEVTKIAFCGLGIKPIYEITKGTLEGGDYIPAGDIAFIGYGERTNQAAIEELLKSGAIGFDKVAAVKGVFNQEQMHLDTWFNIYGNGRAITRHDTFYSPDRETVVYEKTSNGYELRKAGGKIEVVPFSHLIEKELGYDIFTVDEGEQKNYAVNFITLKDGKFIGVRQAQKTFKELQKGDKVDVIMVDADNLTKGYGGPHCMTGPICRAV
ncbi:MAG TPA: arginine deiminase family protein [Candidatus Nanoarchaeia archaeon]|nr:arginine deiminase family protein [Candidatus Nanoarchaeia archaeon]